MAAEAQRYLNEKNIKGLPAKDVELIGKCMEKFERCDKDKNGSLSSDEVKTMIRGTNLSVDALMSSLDLDTDGKVSLDEFLSGVVFMKAEALYRPQFTSFDKDGHGQIEVEDLLQVMKSNDYSTNDIKHFIQEKDIDKDGKLSYDEFLKYYFKTAN